MQEIIQFMASHGYVVEHIIADGKLYRFALDKQDRRKSGWYVAHQRHTPTGECFQLIVFNDWRSSEAPKKFNTLKGKISAEDREFIRKETDRAIKKAEQQRQDEWERVALEAEKKWNSLSDSGDSEYLDRKKIAKCPGLGVRFDSFNGDLYVPIRDINGKIWSLERIQGDGGKYSLPGGRKQDGFHVIGGPISSPVYLAEGLATAASVHLAVDKPVICTFGSNNLIRIANAIRRVHTDFKIIIAGDNDKPDSDKSRTAAEEAARSAGGTVVFPVFAEEGTGTDFNDLHCVEGMGAVCDQLIPSETAVALAVPHERIPAMAFNDQDQKGGRRGTIENIRQLIRLLNITIRYNGVSKEEDIFIPGLATSPDNRANACREFIRSWCDRCKIPFANLDSIIMFIGEENRFHPVADWIESVPWDGRSRLKDLYDTVDAVDNELKEKLMRRWLLSAVAAACEPEGVSAPGILVFHGEQYIGKTMWFKRLGNPDQPRWLLDGAILRPEDKDSHFQVISHWLVELGELDATFRKTDLSQLKAFLCKDFDILRRPFAKKESKFPRRTVFFASVNEPDFLVDKTGNRRFFTVECKSVDYKHTIDMQQLWAEVRVIQKAGESWNLTDGELKALNANNEKFEVVEPIEEMIGTFFDWADPRRDYLTTTEVCQQLGIMNPTTKDLRIAARTLMKVGGSAVFRTNGKRKYQVPPQIVRPLTHYSKKD